MEEISVKKPLGYASMNAIMKNFNFETRRQIHKKIPALRNLDNVVPHTCDVVHLSDYIFGINKFEWKSAHAKNAILKYIQNGARIQKLVFKGFPECWAQKNPDNFRIHVSELQFDWEATLRDCQKLQPFLRDSMPLKRVNLKSPYHVQDLIKEPLIKTCPELVLAFPSRNIDIVTDILMPLENQHVIIPYNYRFRTTNELLALMVHWRNIEKPIGCTFTTIITKYALALDVFDNFKEFLGATSSRIPEPGADFFAHCVVIPVNVTSEIVVSAYVYERRRRVDGFALKMEVKPTGSTLIQ